jgi:hypothetical protein
MITVRIKVCAVGVFAEMYFFEYVSVVEIIHARCRGRGGY